MIESLPKNDSDDLANCCIIYSNLNAYKQDKSSYASIDMLKMTLDEFLNFILKQTFDPLHKIEQQTSNGTSYV